MRTIIKDRPELGKCLLEARARMKKLIQDVDADPVLAAVLQQLEAAEQWTKDGQNMTQPQKDRIVIGIQAVREMTDFIVEQDLVCALHSFIESRMAPASVR